MNKLLKGLSAKQRLAVEKIGFGGILYMDITTVPTMLGLWLVNNYNYHSNTLNVGTHTIKITPELIRDVLGIPMGDVEVTNVERPSNSYAIIRQWRKHVNFFSKLPLVGGIVNFITESNDCGMMFLQSFLVVFITIMGEVKKSSTCNMAWLPSLTGNVSIHQMNWCAYLLDCLNKTKRKWSGTERYNGPLVLLAVFTLSNIV
ncbi:hypothetical protein Hanom_Chr11g00991741 [Helianthus anomalus]